jgi:hypothetical protein
LREQLEGDTAVGMQIGVDLDVTGEVLLEKQKEKTTLCVVFSFF